MTNGIESAQSGLCISLFGPLQVTIDGTPIDRVRSRKEHWLLALLVLRHGREVRRDWLAETLWPDSRVDQSRAYLRASLYVLKQVMRGHAGRIQSPAPHSLRLDLEGASVDVIAFDAAAARGDFESLRALAALYQGPFLEGCDEPWAENERRSREQIRLEALERLAEIERNRGGLREALTLLQRLIAHDPLRESAHRALMRALAENGDLVAMTTAYRDLRILFRNELNADPSPETTALYHRLRGSPHQSPVVGTPSDPVAPISRSDPRHGPEGDDSTGKSAVRLSEFPSGVPAPVPLEQPLTPLIGRRRVIQEISACLGRTRLVTLTGAGGVGKTRIARQIAAEQSKSVDVWFVELASLTRPAMPAHAIAANLQLPEEPGRSAEETLLRNLSNHPGLLVLDNCEHLGDAVALLAGRLLRACPSLRILATSRQALGIAGESRFPAPALDMPSVDLMPGEEPDAARLSLLHQCESILLFEERARAVMPDFRLTARNAVALVEICRLLEGIPLAIELVAAWIPLLTPERMLARLNESRFDLLVSRRRDPEERHRSLWATLDGSYQLLEPELRHFLACMSVFRGGWTLEAAETLCRAEALASTPLRSGQALEFLALLQERSLIQTLSVNGDMRYSLLETVREYSRELLTAAEREILERAHADCFLSLAEAGAPQLIGPQQAVWLDRLEEEQFNMRAALEWCAQHSDATEMGLRFCTALWRFWDVRGHHQEADAWITSFLARDAAVSSALRARAREAAGQLNYGMQEPENSIRWSLEAVEIHTALGDAMGVARALCTVATAELNLMLFESARMRFQSCLPVLEQGDDAYERGRAVSAMGMLEQRTGNVDAARVLLRQGAECYRLCGHLRGLALTLYRSGGIDLVHDAFDQARSFFLEALAISRQVKDRLTLPFGLFHLGRCCMMQEDIAGARTYLTEACATSRANRNDAVEGTCLTLLGDACAREQDIAAACAYYIEALTPYNRLSSAGGVATVAARMAFLALRLRRPADALRLYSYAVANHAQIRTPEAPYTFLLYMSLGYLHIDAEVYDADITTLRTLLPEDFDAICREAHAMTQAEGVNLVRHIALQLS